MGDGRVVSGSLDNTVQIWRADGQCERVLEGHDKTVLSVASLGDGRVAAGAQGRAGRTAGDRARAMAGAIAELVGSLGMLARLGPSDSSTSGVTQN